MKTIITTSVQITTQKFSLEGDVIGIPVETYSEKQEFDTDSQAERYRESIGIWLKELPVPNGDMHPFPRKKVPATEDELFRILDDIHGPDDLWVDTDGNLIIVHPGEILATVKIAGFLQ